MLDLMLHKFHRSLGENKFCWGKQNSSRENKFYRGKTNSIGGKQIPLRDKNSIPLKALAANLNAVNPLIRIPNQLEGHTRNLSKCIWPSKVTLSTSALTWLQTTAATLYLRVSLKHLSSFPLIISLRRLKTAFLLISYSYFPLNFQFLSPHKIPANPVVEWEEKL